MKNQLYRMEIEFKGVRGWLKSYDIVYLKKINFKI